MPLARLMLEKSNVPCTSVPSTGAGALPLKSVTMMPALIPETAGPWDRENSEKTAKGLVQI